MGFTGWKIRRVVYRVTKFDGDSIQGDLFWEFHDLIVLLFLLDETDRLLGDKIVRFVCFASKMKITVDDKVLPS